MADEKFEPCDACKAKLAASTFAVNDSETWVFLCAACRARRRLVERQNMIRKAQDPVAGAFNIRAGLTFEIEGLRERLVSMFTLREADLRAKVQEALETATTDENLDKMIETFVKKEVQESLEREIRWKIKGAIEARLGNEAFRQRLASAIEREVMVAEQNRIR